MHNTESKKTSHISDILKDVFKGLSNNKLETKEKIFNHWTDLLSASESENSRPMGLKDNELLVAVSNNVWFFYFKTHQKRILETIKKDYPFVKKIKFKIGFHS